jgi:hypothetical protein
VPCGACSRTLTVWPFEDLSQFEQKAQAVIQCAQQLTEVVKPAEPEAASRPAEASAAAAASPFVMVQRSPEYLSRMRLEYGQRRLWLWYVYGGAFAMFVLVSLGWEGVLKGIIPLGRHSSGWQVVWGLTIVAVGGLRWLLSRCPSCSTRLYGQVLQSDTERHVIRLWSKHVTCPGCGIQLR